MKYSLSQAHFYYRDIPIVLALFLFPFFVSHAQFGSAYADKGTLQGYIVLITQFVGSTLLPLTFAVALLFFLVNAARYFVLGGAEASEQEKAKTLALYGIGAFVFLVSIWGIVNMFVNAFAIDNGSAKCPDYLGNWCGSGSSSRYSGFGGSGSSYGGSGSNYSSFGGSGSSYGGSASSYDSGGSATNYGGSGSSYNSVSGSGSNYSEANYNSAETPVVNF